MKNLLTTSLVLMCVLSSSVLALVELADPTITGYAKVYSDLPVLDVTNLFDNDAGTTYATSCDTNKGWVHTLLSMEYLDGTWVAFDFGQAVDIDGLMYQNRPGAIDKINTMRLVFSTDATFDASDTVIDMTVIQDNAANEYTFTRQTAQYVLWEVTATPSPYTGYEGNNAGGAEMAFLTVPEPLTITLLGLGGLLLRKRK